MDHVPELDAVPSKLDEPLARDGSAEVLVSMPIRERCFTSVTTADNDEYVIDHKVDKQSVMEMLHRSGHLKLDIEAVLNRE